MSTIEKIKTTTRKTPILMWFAAGLLLLAGLLWLLVGIKSGPTVTGVVQVDGEPLERGSISFVPVDDKGAIAHGRGPVGGASIVEGTYRLEEGLTVGRYRIEIQGIRNTGRK